MKKNLWPSVLLSAATLVAGCRVVDAGKRGFNPPETATAEPALAAAQKLGEGILTAFRDRDFQALQKNTPGDLGSWMSKKDFQTSCRNFQEKFGEIADFRFLTALETPAFGNFIWTVTFIRRGENGRNIRRQLLFRLVTMPVDGKLQVVSCGFL